MRVSRGIARWRRSFVAPSSGEKALKDNLESSPRPPKLSLLGRDYQLPKSRPMRVAMGVVLVLLGCLGFLPVLGFWMIPLGLLVLSYEFHIVRRLRRRMIVKWERRKASKLAAAGIDPKRRSRDSGSPT
ncbi:PGPGW domain-containing protein [Rhizobiaceae sp. 2RAB30]